MAAPVAVCALHAARLMTENVPRPVIAFFQAFGDDGNERAHGIVTGGSGQFCALREFCNQVTLFRKMTLAEKANRLT
ncbi:hypothetical protein ACFQAT_27580 [Undibacterium arcticum]|uniref:Uncharacterized protein n=1 Tax=Undibacterium arcticum TaxID=1762892 RepID=A0ABV7F5Y5_9BURK